MNQCRRNKSGESLQGSEGGRRVIISTLKLFSYWVIQPPCYLLCWHISNKEGPPETRDFAFCSKLKKLRCDCGGDALARSRLHSLRMTWQHNRPRKRTARPGRLRASAVNVPLFAPFMPHVSNTWRVMADLHPPPPPSTLASGWRFEWFKWRTSRLLNSTYPEAVRQLNSDVRTLKAAEPGLWM